MYLGDFSPSGVINYKFTTRNTGSIPTLFSGGALTIYKGSGLENTTTGVTLTTNFNSVTGLNHVNINLATASSFFTTGSDYQIVVLSGSVGDISVVGEAIDTFSMEGRSSVLNTINGIEPGYSLRDTLRLVLSSCAAKLTGVGTNTIYIRDINDGKNRISATVTASGNRTSIIYDVT